jgi:hypothetical protein
VTSFTNVHILAQPALMSAALLDVVVRLSLVAYEHVAASVKMVACVDMAADLGKAALLAWPDTHENSQSLEETTCLVA